MTLSIKTENSLLRQDEIAFVAGTHYPAIVDADDKALAEMRKRIRDLQEKERTFVRQMRRSIRGKADARGASFPGEVERPSRRKQVWAQAAKRLNRETARRRAIAAHEEMKDAARRALALKAGSKTKGRPADQTAGDGMIAIESRKRRFSVNRAKVGSVSQAGKRTQARRDAKGA